jgi:glutamate-5-semialdehyde dehydrogenase
MSIETIRQTDTGEALYHEMIELGDAARAASQALATARADQKTAALREAAASLRRRADRVHEANVKDVEAARARGMDGAILDRLQLTQERIEGMAAGLEAIADLPEPTGQTLAEWDRPNGLHIARVAVPIGVVGIIYESRPNVTADAAGLCIKSGNAAILRGGSESYHSAGAILDCLRDGLAAAGLPELGVQRVPTTNRDAVGLLLGMDRHVDVIVPRGGKSLIERVRAESRIPVLAHLEGVNHTYVQASADPEMARKVVHNAKMRRPGICGATETLLIDRDAVNTHLEPIVSDLLAAKCEVRGDDAICGADERVLPVHPGDWDTEFLAPIISVKMVDTLDDAVAHINHHGSGHTEAILTGDDAAAQAFTERVDAAIVMVNTSTQFADGGEFGMGGEIGIATGKLPPRGPVGAAELTSYKYVVRGAGQIRP